jgi:L-rhamnose isomerase
MIKIENECVGCPPEMGCMGSSCPQMNVKRFYCDNCGAERKLYEYDGKELCLDCIEEKLTVVDGSEDV